MSQTINITDTPTLSLIDLGKVSVNLSAWLGGYTGQDDNAEVTLSFYNQDGTKIGNAITVGPVLSSDRKGITELVFQQNTGKVPVGTRSIQLLVGFTLVSGSDNDGAVDNITAVLNAS